MGRGVKIRWIKVPWVGGKNTMGMGFTIPWVGDSIYHGYGGQYDMGRESKYHE